MAEAAGSPRCPGAGRCGVSGAAAARARWRLLGQVGGARGREGPAWRGGRRRSLRALRGFSPVPSGRAVPRAAVRGIPLFPHPLQEDCEQYRDGSRKGACRTLPGKDDNFKKTYIRVYCTQPSLKRGEAEEQALIPSFS